MPINLVDHPAAPHCVGKQWFVLDATELARLAALVLLGRVHHVARILEGAQRNIGITSPALKARLQHDLFPAAGVDPWHRDGLLFEVICWLVARMNAGPSEVISDPHLKSTQQGADTIKVELDIVIRFPQDCFNHESSTHADLANHDQSVQPESV